ncbi:MULTISPECIES: transmembrane transport protein [unclassified Streptomyces]|uniref:transmembrane transport protein n=1 Tax=unclassified Streptomyces TaxID=2593676 RepID=UPI000B1A6A28|nr:MULTISPECIES: transmembrane transport protein [unclassified Streptomyces]AZM58818.1 transmembrane transport protein [Streptomyces sp. WAC 01438]RSM91217.1 transmembrane transport protein [Streptomyces sp. WAC 01420]
MSEPDDAARRAVPERLERVLATEVSLRSRLRHVAVGLAGGCGAAVIAVLWATEPHAPPPRTRVVFAGLIAVGLAWAVFAGWVLSRRRPLFARDRVLSARIALAATVVTASAGVALAAVRGGTAGLVATTTGGVVLTAAAMITLVRARRRRRELLRLRDALRQDAS